MNVYDLVAKHEGFRSKPYRDTVGKLTIGYGRNLEGKGITESEAMTLLIDDVQEAYIWLNTQWWFRPLGQARQAAIIDMAMMGETRFREFARLIDALEKGDFERAAMEMLSSEWEKQVGLRAHEDAEIMRRGAFPPFD